jgi:hypothetical protein
MRPDTRHPVTQEGTSPWRDWLAPGVLPWAIAALLLGSLLLFGGPLCLGIGWRKAASDRAVMAGAVRNEAVIRQSTVSLGRVGWAPTRTAYWIYADGGGVMQINKEQAERYGPGQSIQYWDLPGGASLEPIDTSSAWVRLGWWWTACVLGGISLGVFVVGARDNLHGRLGAAGIGGLAGSLAAIFVALLAWAFWPDDTPGKSRPAGFPNWTALREEDVQNTQQRISREQQQERLRKEAEVQVRPAPVPQKGRTIYKLQSRERAKEPPPAGDAVLPR